MHADGMIISRTDILGIGSRHLLAFFLGAGRSGLRLEDILQVDFFIRIADVASLGPELGKMSVARIANDGHDAMAWSEALGQRSSSNT